MMQMNLQKGGGAKREGREEGDQHPVPDQDIFIRTQQNSGGPTFTFHHQPFTTSSLVGSGLVCSGLVWVGLVGSGLVWFGLVCDYGYHTWLNEMLLHHDQLPLEGVSQILILGLTTTCSYSVTVSRSV